MMIAYTAAFIALIGFSLLAVLSFAVALIAVCAIGLASLLEATDAPARTIGNQANPFACTETERL